MRRRAILNIFILIWAALMGGCIHEYPLEAGRNPERVNANLEITFNLRWDYLLHKTEFSTKASDSRRHRFILEAKKGDKIICRDIVNLSDDEFSFGNFSHKFSSALPASLCQIVVWYDRLGDDGYSKFNIQKMSEVKASPMSFEEMKDLRCGYASETYDLTHLAGQPEALIEKEIIMAHCGAKFEFLATDINKFIENQKAALLQGDSFDIRVIMNEETPDVMDIYRNTLSVSGDGVEFFDDMPLPFGVYDELDIAHGFLFCNVAREVSASLVVYNSSRMIVAQTPSFSFPIKPGYITLVTGEFLTSPLDGSLSIDNIWEGEIEVEIE